MDYEDCEVSWIVQADYSALWAAMPQLEELTVKGSNELSFGKIEHDTLKSLTIICGGLPTDVIGEIQNEITEAVLHSKYMKSIKTLDLSLGTLTDKGGQLLLDNIGTYPNIENLDLHYNYLSDDMAEKLEKLSISVNVEEREEPDEYDGEIYYYPMLTE